MKRLKRWFYSSNGVLAEVDLEDSWPKKFHVLNGAWQGYIYEDLTKVQVLQEDLPCKILWTADELPLEEGGYNSQIAHIKGLLND